MQTFLPYPDFEKCAHVLDRQRLGKQRVECLQILDVLVNGKKAWSNHPAVRMWKGYEQVLCLYGICICDEWYKRGYKDTCREKICNIWEKLIKKEGKDKSGDWPIWISDEFCASHRAALLFKNLEWYGKFGWTEKPEINYIWPVQNEIQNRTKS